MTSSLAFFKVRPTHSAPFRPGPLQCIRNCTNCIIKKQSDEDDMNFEELIRMKCYEDLVYRNSLWFSPHQTIQYHQGQVDLLKKTLHQCPSKFNIYVVALGNLKDLHYFNTVLKYNGIPDPVLIEMQSHSVDFVKKKQQVIIPILFKSCSSSENSERNLLTVRSFRDYLDPIVVEASNDRTFDPNVVPVIVTKEHDNRTLFGIGSLCVQILEPYSVQDYIGRLWTMFLTGHLVQHLYYDIARHAALMPSHLVAFLILYLDRDDGVSRQDLLDYMNYLKKASMELNLQIAFTGDIQDAIELGLMILKDFIHYDSERCLYWPTKVEHLMDYASVIIPNIAYYGIIGRAILMLHNQDESNEFQIKMNPEITMRVMKDDLLELSQNLAESIDHQIPCRRPCNTVETAINSAFSQMETFCRFFKIEEPKIKQKTRIAWCDYDSDDEYFHSKRDHPAFKSWVVVTQRANRLDRLNLFINAIVPYFFREEN